MSLIAVEIGGTKLQVALGESCGKILDSRLGDARQCEGAAGIVSWVERAIEELLKVSGQRGEAPRAIGIGFGGPVDSRSGTVLVSHQVPGWEGFPLRERLQDRFGLPVVLENDSNAAGWAEYCKGAGQGTRNFAYMNIGSGIGGALIVDGRLLNGQGLGAGELGHTWVPDLTRAGAPPAKLEELCSGWAIEDRLLKAGLPWTCAQLADRARNGNPEALDEIERVAEALAIALGNLVTLFHPERIAVGGGVALMGGILFDPLRRRVDRYAFGPYRGRYEIVPCALEESVVLVGALLLAREHIAR